MQLVLDATKTFAVFYRNLFYFRIYGYGLWIGISRAHQPLFSERYGYHKVWRRFGLAIKILTP